MDVLVSCETRVVIPRYDVLGQDVEVKVEDNVLREALRAILDMLGKARLVSKKTASVVGRDIKWRSCYDALFGRISFESSETMQADASTVKVDSTARAPNTLRDV
jgi:hypothetical protein